MKSNQIRLFVILAAFVCVGYAEGSCRFYEEELAVNQTWASCKELCAQKKGSCLAWDHNMATNRCTGWMLESQSETTEKDTYYPADNNDAEAGVAAKDEKEGDSKDDDARASAPSQDDIFFEFDDDEESTAEAYYAEFYNTVPEIRETERHSEDQDTTTQQYYNAFYNVQTSGGAGESDDDDEDTTSQDYYDAYYNTPMGSGGTESEYDEARNSSSTYDFHYNHGSPGFAGYGYFSYDTRISSSSNGSLQANATSRGLKEQKSDPPIQAVVERYRSLDRGPLYEQCEVIATVSFITPVNSVSSTMKDCFFHKVKLIDSTTQEQCNAVCQNLHSSANASCIAWMWRAEQQDCIGLALKIDSNYSFCGLP